jgi:plasmid stabilization system protein ParE
LAAVFWTRSAARDLEQVQGWLTQPGSGRRAHVTVERIKAAADALATTAMQYAPDPHRPISRRMVIDRHVVRFRVIAEGDGPGLVVVERVFGPGQEMGRDGG